MIFHEKCPNGAAQQSVSSEVYTIINENRGLDLFTGLTYYNLHCMNSIPSSAAQVYSCNCIYRTICLQFSHIFFTDIVTFTIQLLVIPTSKGNNSRVLTVASTEALYNIIYRTGHTNSSNTVFQTWLTSVNYTVNASRSAGSC